MGRSRARRWKERTEGDSVPTKVATVGRAFAGSGTAEVVHVSKVSFVFDSFCLVDLSAPSFRERARKSFGSERERADHPVRPTVVVASVTTIGGQEGNDRRG